MSFIIIIDYLVRLKSNLIKEEIAMFKVFFTLIIFISESFVKCDAESKYKYIE